jgi:hypothetical protein
MKKATIHDQGGELHYKKLDFEISAAINLYLFDML